MLVRAVPTARAAQRPHPAVGPRGENAASVRSAPTGIESLLGRYGWLSQDAWQRRLLEAADRHTGHPDGLTTVREVDDYLADPDDLEFLSSDAMQKERALLPNGRVRVRDVQDGWRRAVAAAAAGQDGVLETRELDQYFDRVKARTLDHEWMPDQKLAPFESRIAEVTHEADDLTPRGELHDAGLYTRTYMRFAADLHRRIPQWVTHVVSASDLLESEEPPRKNSFEQDPGLGDLGAVDADYDGIFGKWDSGHHKAAEDAVDWASMVESCYLSNVAAQAWKLNRGPWKYLEEATRELVSAYGPGTQATIVAGNLFQDDAGQPLPEDRIQWLPEGRKRVAIPTHFYKAVLVRFPDGKAKTFAYLCPNSNEGVSQKLKPSLNYLAEHRVSVDALEARVGFDLFGSLDDRVEARIEADASPRFTVPEPAVYTLAARIFGAEASEVDEEE